MINLDKIQEQAPGLISLAKAAAVSLDKAGLAGQQAAVQLVLDHSGSMHPYYADGSVQRLAEQVLGLSVNLDDDGSVPVSYFGSWVDHTCDVRLDNYQGVINRSHTSSQWGSTNYAAAIPAAVAEHDASGASDPGLVVFQTDGEPDDQDAAKRALRAASTRPLFFAFVGFGPARNMRFLKKLDNLSGRAVDNASFFHAADPAAVTDEELYDGITREFAQWLPAARAAGIVQ